MKIIGMVKSYNEGQNGNLERCLNHLSKFVDEIVCCDDSSTDNSLEIAKKYTNHIITLPNDFKAELEHKQKLLELALSLNPEWIIHLDPDEVLDKPEKVRELCKHLDKNGYDGAYCHLINLWMSDKNYRVDEAFNRLWKTPIWKNNGKLIFRDIKTLHQPQHPVGLDKVCHSDIQIIHYGFSTKELIERKYNTYKDHGQTGWGLERLNPNSKARLKPLIKKDLTPDVTIGVPCFNPNLEYLKECLNSIVEQDFDGKIETIVVDDGSENGEEIKNICNVFSYEYIRNEKNKGIGFTRNKIIKSANGKFLCFLSCDDYYLPDYIKTMIGSYDEDAFYYSNYYLLNNNQLIEYRTPIFKDNEDFVFACIGTARENKMFVCYNIMAPLSLWQEVPFWDDKRYGEDLSHLLEALLIKKKKFIHVLKLLYVYRDHPQMTTAIIIKNIPENNKDTFDRINKKLGVDII